MNSLSFYLYVLFSNTTGLLPLPSSKLFPLPPDIWMVYSLTFFNSLFKCFNIMFSMRLPFTPLFYPTSPLDISNPQTCFFAPHHGIYLLTYLSLPGDIFSLLLEGERGREREKHWLLPPTWAWTQDSPHPDWGLNLQCALTQNWTHNFSVTGWHSNQWSHTGQIGTYYFYISHSSSTRMWTS